MSDTLTLLVLFVTSALLAFGLTKWAHRRKTVPVEDLQLPGGQTLRLLTASGGYRCHLLDQSPKGLVVSAPLHRDCHVPLRVGEDLVVQSPGFDSLLTFRTKVVERDPLTHQLKLALPSSMRRTDRRCEPRIKNPGDGRAEVNGRSSILCDVSGWGAKILTLEPVRAGDLVNVSLPGDYGTALAYALEVRTSAHEGRLCKEVRLRFDEPLAGLGRGSQRLYVR